PPPAPRVAGFHWARALTLLPRGTRLALARAVLIAPARRPRPIHGDLWALSGSGRLPCSRAPREFRRRLACDLPELLSRPIPVRLRRVLLRRTRAGQVGQLVQILPLVE